MYKIAIMILFCAAVISYPVFAQEENQPEEAQEAQQEAGLAVEVPAVPAAEAAAEQPPQQALPKTGLKTPQECQALCDNFMKLIDQEKFNDAFALLKPYWPLPESEMAMLQMQTTTQLDTIGPRFGKAVSSELISIKPIGDFVNRYIYVQKRQYHIVRWKLIFYKPKDGWLVNAVTFDDNIEALFE